MICVTIACGSHTRMIAEHQRLADGGVKLAELRLDFLRREADLSRLIPTRPTATLITVRRQQDGGLWRESEEKRLTLLRSAIAKEPEFVDLEVDIANQISPFGSTRRIISYHNMDAMPENLDALHSEMSSKSPYFIKIAATPKSVDEMVRFLVFVKAKNEAAKKQGEKGVRVIGICMGELGKATRILAKKFGMPYTYATFSEDRLIAPGMLVYKELLDLYHYEQLNQDTEVFGIIGNPLGHTLSPLIHNRSFVDQKINAVYVPFQLAHADVASLVNYAGLFNLKGLSVTIPHKTAVLHSLTKIDPAVEKIGACNTVIFHGSDRLGYNTDYMAAVSGIEIAMNGSFLDQESVLKNQEALILGCGGAGKALAYGLMNRGANVTLSDRKSDQSFELSKQLGCQFINWADRESQKPDILVNCTSVGMFPKVDETPFAKAALRSTMLVFDAVYNPENTLLIKSAKEKGCRTVSGVEMFVGQACLQFKLFTGKKASPPLMRRLVKEALQIMNR